MTSNTTPSPEDAMDSFLALEYEQCISLLTRYDDRQLELAQHATIISCAVVAVVFGLSTITDCTLSLIHISEPTRLVHSSRMPSSA